MLLDDTGETIETWGIQAFPTLVLIDPQGRVVKGDAEAMLAKILDE